MTYTYIVVGIVGVVIINCLFFLLFFKEGENIPTRVVVVTLLTLLTALVVGLTTTSQGFFGRPNTLDNKTYYKVLSVTPIDGGSTVVILRDGKGRAVSIEFVTQIKADTNGFYTLDGSNHGNYTLVPIK